MRRTADRGGRFPTVSAFERVGGDESKLTESAGDRRRPSSFSHDDSDDGGPACRSATWPQPSVTAGSLTWSTEATAPLVPVTSRQRTAWMLAHVPDYSSSHQQVDISVDKRERERVDTRHMEVDRSAVGPPRWRPTMMTATRFPDADTQLQAQTARRYRHIELPTSTKSFPTRTHEIDGAAAPLSRPGRYHGGEQPGYWEEEQQAQYPLRYFDDQSIASTRGFDGKQPPAAVGKGYLSADGASEIDSVGAVQDVDSETTAEPNVPKTSRYLREMDRRVILERLAQGEKQAPLAKEFNVSRAAISNLYKHRHEILARTDEDPFAKHPKKKKRTKRGRSRTQRAQSLNALEDGMDDDVDSGRTPPEIGNAMPQPSVRATTIIVDAPTSRSSLVVTKSYALPILLSTMGDMARTIQDFRRVSERSLWLLLEEALASVPLDASDTASDRSDVYPNYTALFPPCAISMERETLDATPMLNIFQLMEPQQPSGIATITTQHDSLTVEITDGDRLPHSLRGYNVFLLDIVAASGEAVCAAIEKLLRELGALEANVSVVALFTSSEVVAMVQCKYPLAKILTARIDSSITRRRIVSTPVDLIVRRMRDAYSADR